MVFKKALQYLNHKFFHMEKGDIVICEDDAGVREYGVFRQQYYTIREYMPPGTPFYCDIPWMSDDGSGGVFLEEVRVDLYGYDHPLRASRFRKVEPMDISELVAEKEEEYV